jgi:hypothetical protein
MSIITKRLATIEAALPVQPIDGIHQREPKDLEELRQWVAAGCGFVMQPGGMWEQLARSAQETKGARNDAGDDSSAADSTSEQSAANADRLPNLPAVSAPPAMRGSELHLPGYLPGVRAANHLPGDAALSRS